MNALLKKITLFTFLSCILCIDTYAIVPNPIISLNKPVYGSRSGTSNLVNGKFGETSWGVSDGAWIAIKAGEGKEEKIFFSWNSPGYSWSDQIASTTCPQNMGVPVDYDILCSSNSTNGEDGIWKTAVTIRNNAVTSRGHIVDFSGSNWVKMNIIKGGGALDEIEIHDISNGNEDTWFFPGTSISANSFKANVPKENFSNLITKSHPSFTPAMIRGAIPCITSSDMARDISKYLDMARNTHYWAIEMGTNDAWGGNNGNVTRFKKNMQLIIDSCKAAGVKPIIARMICTIEANAGWQIHQDFLKAIDDLTLQNNLIAGPDLYSAMLNQPSYFAPDGVHPNADGGAKIHALWAQKMNSIYQSSTDIIHHQFKLSKLNNISFARVHGKAAFDIKSTGTLLIYNTLGSLIERKNISSATRYFPQISKNGLYIVHFAQSSNEEVLRIHLP